MEYALQIGRITDPENLKIDFELVNLHADTIEKVKDVAAIMKPDIYQIVSMKENEYWATQVLEKSPKLELLEKEKTEKENKVKINKEKRLSLANALPVDTVIREWPQFDRKLILHRSEVSYGAWGDTFRYTITMRIQSLEGNHTVYVNEYITKDKRLKRKRFLEDFRHHFGVEIYSVELDPLHLLRQMIEKDGELQQAIIEIQNRNLE
jgi:hypothetical protein